MTLNPARDAAQNLLRNVLLKSGQAALTPGLPGDVSPIMEPAMAATTNEATWIAEVAG